MPFNRPTLPALVSRAEADMRSRLAGVDPLLRRNLTSIIARMEAGTAHGLYGYLDWLALQLMPDTAESEHLERWASIWGVFRKASGKAGGMAALTGRAGAVLPAGTIWQRSDAVQYETTAESLIDDAGTGNTPVRALAAGVAGNAPAGVTLSLTLPVDGIVVDAVAVNGLSGGTEAETDESLRARLLSCIRNPPMGGNKKDYETWALAVPGVTRVFVTAGEMGRGSVTVRFMMDDTYPDGIPEDGDRAAVAAYIEPRRPVTADVYVACPIACALDLRAVITPDTAAVRRQAEAMFREAVRRDAVPGGTILLSRLNEALSVAVGEEDHAILSPAANVVMPSAGHIAVPGTIEWVSA